MIKHIAAVAVAVAGWIGLPPPKVVPPVPPIRAAEDPVSRAWRTLERELAEQNRQRAEARRGPRELPRAITRPADALLRPDYARELDEAFYFRVTADPVAAARELATASADDTDAVFARRLELLTIVLGGDRPTPPDAVLGEAVEAVARLSAQQRRIAREAVIGSRWAVSRQMLARLRADRLSGGVALRFAVAADDPTAGTVAALALIPARPSVSVLDHWRNAEDLCEFEARGLGFLTAEGLSLSELESFLAALVREQLATTEQLRRERQRQLAAVRPGRAVEPFQLGLRGTDDALPADVARLLHAPTRARLSGSGK